MGDTEPKDNKPTDPDFVRISNRAVRGKIRYPEPPSEPAPLPDVEVKIPRGIRINNPGNIIKSDIAWVGKIAGKDPEYEGFELIQDGLNAMSKNLDAYHRRRHLTTVESVMRRWSPHNPKAAENVTYFAEETAKQWGVKFDKNHLDANDPVTREIMMRAIIQAENGRGTDIMYFSAEQLKHAAYLATEKAPDAAARRRKDGNNYDTINPPVGASKDADAINAGGRAKDPKMTSF